MTLKTARVRDLEGLLNLSIDSNYYDDLIVNIFGDTENFEPENIENYADFSYNYGVSTGYISAIVDRATRNYEDRIILSETTSNHIIALVTMKGLLK